MIGGIGRDTDEPEKPTRFYNTPEGATVRSVRIQDVYEGVRIDVPSHRGDGPKPEIVIPHSLLPDDYRWRGQGGSR